MAMQDLHRRLLQVGLEAGADLGLVLAGGYALMAHGLVDRPSQDVDFATSSALPMADIVARLGTAYRTAGFTVEPIEGNARMARPEVFAPDIRCEVDVMKEAIGPPRSVVHRPVLAFDDAIGLKVRALHDRSTHRDFIDVRAAAGELSFPELERLGARHTAGFSPGELADRLGAVGELDVDDFAGDGLAETEITALPAWAYGWENDIRGRLAAGESGPEGVPDDGWDAYLDLV